LFPSRVSTGRHPLRAKATVSHGDASYCLIFVASMLAATGSESVEHPPQAARPRDFDGNNVIGERCRFLRTEPPVLKHGCTIDPAGRPTCREQKTWLAPDRGVAPETIR
jgi:hypothetical protein